MLLPIFIFHDHGTMIAAEAHFIPYPGCVETLLPRAIQKTINDCKNTPDEGFPHLSNTVTTDLENPKMFITIFETLDLKTLIILKPRYLARPRQGAELQALVFKGWIALFNV